MTDFMSIIRSFVLVTFCMQSIAVMPLNGMLFAPTADFAVGTNNFSVVNSVLKGIADHSKVLVIVAIVAGCMIVIVNRVYKNSDLRTIINQRAVCVKDSVKTEIKSSVEQLPMPVRIFIVPLRDIIKFLCGIASDYVTYRKKYVGGAIICSIGGHVIGHSGVGYTLAGASFATGLLLSGINQLNENINKLTTKVDTLTIEVGKNHEEAKNIAKDNQVENVLQHQKTRSMLGVLESKFMELLGGLQKLVENGQIAFEEERQRNGKWQQEHTEKVNIFSYETRGQFEGLHNLVKQQGEEHKKLIAEIPEIVGGVVREELNRFYDEKLNNSGKKRREIEAAPVASSYASFSSRKTPAALLNNQSISPANYIDIGCRTDE